MRITYMTSPPETVGEYNSGVYSLIYKKPMKPCVVLGKFSQSSTPIVKKLPYINVKLCFNYVAF